MRQEVVTGIMGGMIDRFEKKIWKSEVGTQDG
jgi:hypothetical protein